MILTIAAHCMALNIYFESRGESIKGQYAVAMVTMNRAHQDIDQVCKAVLAPKQFSWTNTMVVDGKLIKGAEPKDKVAYQKAIVITRNVLAGWVSDTTDGSTSYHALSVHPAWQRSMVSTKIVGQHIFYRNI